MRSKLLVLLIAMGLVLTIGMTIKKYNFDHDTYYTPWQMAQMQVHSFLSSK